MKVTLAIVNGTEPRMAFEFVLGSTAIHGVTVYRITRRPKLEERCRAPGQGLMTYSR